MKYHISREQHFFFEKNRFIEFEGLLSDKEGSLLASLTTSLGTSKVINGRDTALDSAELRKIIFLPRLAKLGAELAIYRKLRYGFDQIITWPLKVKTLENSICIKGLIICLFLSIDDAHSPGIYFLPGVELTNLPLIAGQKYLLIGWADERAQYIFQPEDLHTHDLKHRGYVFGDRLQEKTHPILIR